MIKIYLKHLGAVILSVSVLACGALRPELDPWYPHGGWRELTPVSYSLISAHTSQFTAHTNTFILN